MSGNKLLALYTKKIDLKKEHRLAQKSINILAKRGSWMTILEHYTLIFLQNSYGFGLVQPGDGNYDTIDTCRVRLLFHHSPTTANNSSNNTNYLGLL